MNELQQVLNDIKQDKNTNLLPGNLRDNVTCLGIEGTAKVPIPIYATTDYTIKNASVSVLNTGDKLYNNVSIKDGYCLVSSYDRNNFDIYRITETSMELLSTPTVSFSGYGTACIIKKIDNLLYIMRVATGKQIVLYTFNVDTLELFSIKVKSSGRDNTKIMNYYDTDYVIVFNDANDDDEGVIYKLSDDNTDVVGITSTPGVYFSLTRRAINKPLAPNIFGAWYSPESSSYQYMYLAKCDIESNSWNQQLKYFNTDGHIVGVSYDGTKAFILNKGIYTLNSDLSIGEKLADFTINMTANRMLSAINDRYYILCDYSYINKYGDVDGDLYEFDNETNTFTYINSLSDMIYHPGHLAKIDTSTRIADVYDFVQGTTQIGISMDGKNYYYTDNNPVTSDKILAGYETYTKGYQPIIGTMPNNGELNITPTTENQNIPEGYTSGGTVLGDENLKSENIKKDVSIFGVTGSLESSLGQLKLFETQEEMQANSTAKEGDLAVVYREEIQNMTADTETQYITFPETVTLPEAFTDSFRGMLIPVDTSSMFDGQIQLRKTRFTFDGYSESGRITVQYNSSDGITYTRTRFNGNSGELTNPVDLGTIVKYESMESWNDALGYFMLVGGMRFDGLYEYGNYLLEGTYCNSYGVNTELNDIPYLSPNISRPDEVGYDYNIIVVTDSHLDESGLYKVIDKCKVLWYGGGYGRDAVYNGKQGILVTLYEPNYAESSSTNLNLVLEEYDFTVSTNPTSKQIIRNWDDISIFPSPIYVAQARSSSSDPYNRKWYFTSYENADYTGNGHAVSYKHTIYSVPSDITLPISSTGYSTPEGITSTYGADYYVNIYTNKYKLAQNQYNLTSSNQLYPNISAYGKNGNVTGDGSIYDNTLTPTEYNESNSTLDEILEGYKPVDATQMNLFVQSTEPDSKNGIWVKNDSIYVDNTNIFSLDKSNIENITWDSSLKTTNHNSYMASYIRVDNYLYLLGGGNNPNKFSRFNLVNGDEESLEDLPFSVNDCGFCGVGSYIYMFGGSGTPNRAIKYNVLTKEMTSLTDVPYNSVDSFCAYYDGNIYIFGGSNSYRSVYKYSIKDDSYEQLSNLDRGYNSNVSGCIYNNKVYLFGNGYNDSRENCKKLTIYNLLDNSIQTITMPKYLAAGVCINISNYIYVIGNSFNIGSNPFRLCYVYDTISGEFSALDSLPIDTYYGAAALYNGTLYIYMVQKSYSGYSGLISLDGANSLNIIVGNSFKTLLLNNMKVSFNDIIYLGSDLIEDTTTPIYYGDGTQWIKFKGEVDN